ncbi:arylsulfatase-like protein [Xylaria bambusicola]|uniref:arylsulfatase-like protein n=1 Tax=Xylaria bambusicola TaxID=326684 RepID=UPI00200819A8|nr:arylsulfatase-like protein [Xylaria bambusicola]KAI0513279.1 arylsulfatase-like protein [Xylaria bambusicola]
MKYLLISTLLASLVSFTGAQWPYPYGPINQDLLAKSGRDRPNIVFILTDDQDIHMQSLDYMPFVKKHLLDRGTFFKKHFCTTALCCPSRVSLWTGRAAHNHNVTDVQTPHGGYPKFISQGLNDKYLPVWLQAAGYNTYYTGKLFNAHSVQTYNSPFVAGWTASDFLLDPFTYWYMNSTYQRNQDPPVSYEGQHTVDVLAKKALDFLDEAHSAGKPFFLGIAPVAPHSDIQSPHFPEGDDDDISEVYFGPPVPAERFAHLFPDVKVPRTANFNPDKPSGGNWVRALPKQSPENVEYNDHFYRQRLRALQSIDEIVDNVFSRLEDFGILENTYIVYSTDNGYHIGQHRLNPSKQCSFEEDINIPLIIRGPGVPQNFETDIVTTHTDLAPTLLQLAGIPLRDDFDGLAIPLSKPGIDQAKAERHEHVTVEHWGFAANEAQLFDWYPRIRLNNTYKALRVIGDSYNLHYHVWCTNEHELHDLTTDPGQMNNLLHPDAGSGITLLGLPLEKVRQRLDALLFVLKSCRAESCIHPWRELHPAGNVETLKDALSSRFDEFYATETENIKFDRCEMGYLVDAEGPQFKQTSPKVGVREDWHIWT